MLVICEICGFRNREGASACEGCAARLTRFSVSEPSPLERINAFNSWQQRVRPRAVRRSSHLSNRSSSFWLRLGVLAVVLGVGAATGYYYANASQTTSAKQLAALAVAKFWR